MTVVIDGESLSLEQVVRVARLGEPVWLSETAIERMRTETKLPLVAIASIMVSASGVRTLRGSGIGGSVGGTFILFERKVQRRAPGDRGTRAYIHCSFGRRS